MSKKKTVEPDLCGKQNDVCWLCGNCGYSLPNVEVQEFEASLTVTTFCKRREKLRKESI